MPMPLVSRATSVAAVLIPLLLAGCESDRSFSGNPFAPAAPPPAATPAPPPVNMAGQWTLASPGGGACGMNFSGKPGATDGAIAPGGGCPGAFYTSRHWSLQQNTLAIIDHKNDTLANLVSSNPPSRFEGHAAGGMVVTLSR